MNDVNDNININNEIISKEENEIKINDDFPYNTKYFLILIIHK